MSELKTYAGSCHCGNVRYEVKADIQGLVSCNCSMCGRTGALLAFVPRSQFTLQSGGDAVTDYQFNKKKIHHYFCSNCGIRSYAFGNMPDGTPMAAINVRCLEDFDHEALPVKKFDGKSL